MPETIFLTSWLAAGVAFGAVYLWLIARTVSALQRPAAPRLVLAFLGLRLVLAAGVLTLAAKQGALPLLAVLAGFLIARSVAIHMARRA